LPAPSKSRPPSAAPAVPQLNGADARPTQSAISIDDLVARARAISAAAVSPRDPPPQRMSPSTPTAAPFRMPDLGESSDRLRVALREIEEAAARARAYRPNQKP
jgi:branched-chain amino acid transport system ATP-binding protein